MEYNDDNNYQKATVAYDENGKLTIDAYNVYFDPQDQTAHTHQIHYLEDSYIRVVFEREHSEKFSIPSLLFVDLTDKSYTTVASRMTEIDGNGNITYHPIATFHQWVDGYYVSLEPAGIQIFQNDREIIQYHENMLRENTVGICLPLNNLTGCSSVESFSGPDPFDNYHLLHTRRSPHRHIF